MKKLCIILIALLIASGVIAQIAQPCSSCLTIGIIFYEILKIVSTKIFDKTPLNELFIKTDYQNIKERIYNQLYLI